jgi:ABC-type phosphate transport system substrate-binding protein
MNVLGRALACFLLGVAALATSAHAQDGFRVIVNPANPVTSLRESELSRLFLKKTVSWPTGAPVAAVDQERTSSVRKAFSLEIHAKDPDAIVAHWQTMVFSGRDTPPPVEASDASVVDFVRANPGAIGYVSPGTDLSGVKLLAVR